MPDDKPPAPFIPLTLPGASELASDDSIAEPVISASLQAQTREVLARLTPREEAVLRERFGIGPATADTDEAEQSFEITRQRIREIEARALAKLRQRRDDDDE